MNSCQSADLLRYLDDHCVGLLDRLVAEWYVQLPARKGPVEKQEGGVGALRAIYAAQSNKGKAQGALTGNPK